MDSGIPKIRPLRESGNPPFSGLSGQPKTLQNKRGRGEVRWHLDNDYRVPAVLWREGVLRCKSQYCRASLPCRMQELHIDYPKVKTEKDSEQQTKDFKVHSKMEADLREQDLDLLFKLMRKHIQTWWD